jgi:hypothetical protein
VTLFQAQHLDKIHFLWILELQLPQGLYEITWEIKKTASVVRFQPEKQIISF